MPVKKKATTKKVTKKATKVKTTQNNTCLLYTYHIKRDYL